MSRIVLVSPGHPSCNPRLVKEADALTEVGHEVVVVHGDTYQPARELDEQFLPGKPWGAQVVRVRHRGVAYRMRRLTQVIARRLYQSGWRSLRWCAVAHHSLSRALKQATSELKAELYIGHNLAALPAVVAAGHQHRTRVGFDAEDFHSGEAPEVGPGRLDNAIARTLETRLLRCCEHLTASSPLISKAYLEHYGVDAKTILNVFPECELFPPQPAPEVPSFYWFSQTVGPGRGIEEYIQIALLLGRPIRLDLRGHIAEGYAKQLKQRVLGSTIQLRLLEPDLPGSMVRDAVGYTAGLALEQREPLNRDLCLTNKAFTYLLAGTPVVLSRTRAQEQLATELGAAGLLLDLADPKGAALRLAGWLGNPDAVRCARAEALRLGRERYNWDREKEIFLRLVESGLRTKGQVSSCFHK